MEELRVPGPTPCPPQVIQAMARQMVNHRSKEFEEMTSKVMAGLKQVFQTKNDVLLLTGSGTGGLEAVIANTLSPGDKVLSLCNGAFGQRWIAVAQRFGADVVPLRFEWGKPVDVDSARQALKKDAKIRAVMVTHNETSTGVTNDMKTIGSLVREFDKLLLVDSISGLGSINLPVDDWNCDVVVTASQKAWMVPPGMVMVSVNERGWQAHAQAKMPHFYWDFTEAKKYADKGQTPWTPAVSIIFGLADSLDMMLKEGLHNIFERHARVGQAARQGVKALGLSLLADEACASNTVTAVNCPESLDTKKLLQILIKDHRVILADGQGKLAGKIFRIGHLGWVNEEDIKAVMAALKVALPKAGSVGVKV